jgi:Trk K+ transport system NAD-binding subunit
MAQHIYRGLRDNEPSKRQSFTLWQRIRARLYGRSTLLVESFIALLLLVIVIAGDMFYLLQSNLTSGVLAAFQGALSIIALNVQGLAPKDATGQAIIIANLLFSLLFAQSILNSTRVIFKQRPLEEQQLGLAKTLNNHVIVCGLGRIGIRIVERLVNSGIPVCAISYNLESSFAKRAHDLHVPVISGDAAEPEILQSAGIINARAIIACIAGDLIDLQIALTARNIKPGIRVIVRSFFENFDSGVEKNLGTHTAFSASALAAPTFAAAMLSRSFKHVLTLGNELVAVAEIIAPAKELHSQLQQIEQDYNMRALPPTRGATRGTIVGKFNDIIALQRALPQLFHSESAAKKREPVPTSNYDTYIICGLGKVGYRVALLLHQLQPDQQIVVVQRDNDEHEFFADNVKKLGNRVRFIEGDARGTETLKKAGIDRAIAIAALTSDDQTNVQIGLEARRLQEDVHVVLRVFGDKLEDELTTMFGIGTAYSTTRLASPAMAAASISSGVTQAFAVDDIDGLLYVVGETYVEQNSIFANARVGDLWAKRGMLVAGICRNPNSELIVLPTDATTISPNDLVTVIAPLDVLAKLREFVPREVRS